jgi:CRP-like cAMP-binding protein
MEAHEIAMLEGEEWFGGLSPSRRRAMLERVTVQLAERGSHVYRQGDPPNGLFALLAGELRMVSYSATGVEMVAMVVRPGLWFGELSVIDGKSRPHDAIATARSRLARLPMSAIAALTAAEPDLWRDIARLGCEHQRLNMRHSERVRTQPAVVRLAGFLLGKAESSPARVIPMTQEGLAEVVGVSRQRINALLRELAGQGLTRPVYGGVEIPDPGGLRRFLASHG